MNRNIQRHTARCCLASAITLLLVSHSAAARVSSLGPDRTVVINGKPHKSVSVNCKTREARPTLLKAKGSRKWCDSEISSVCYADKLRAAKYVCSPAYSSLSKQIAAAEQPKSSAQTSSQKNAQKNRSELIAELHSIEEALIDIERKRLQLRRQELALKSQTLESQTVLNSFATE